METKNYYKKKLDKIKEELPTMSTEDLIEVLQYSYVDYIEFYRRDDSIEWSEENESLIREIYFAVKNEIIHRLTKDDSEDDDE